MFRLLRRSLDRMHRRLGYGGRRCHICRSSQVTCQANGGRWFCARCARIITG